MRSSRMPPRENGSECGSPFEEKLYPACYVTGGGFCGGLDPLPESSRSSKTDGAFSLVANCVAALRRVRAGKSARSWGMFRPSGHFSATIRSER
jgi:hypothetical protein